MRYWEDDWCRGGVLKEVSLNFSFSRKKQSSISSSVSTGVYPHNWNLDLRRNLIVGEIDEVIRLLDILDGVRLVPSRLDKRRWKLDHSGLFSYHSFCSFTPKDDYKEDFSPYSQIWKTKTPPKVKILLWQVARGRVNTCDLLQGHRPFMCLSPHWCALCKSDGETVDHMFIHCPYALKVWWLLLGEVNAVWVTPKGCFKLLSCKIDALGRGKKAKVLWGNLLQAMIWNLWVERNRRIFDDYKGVEASELWDRVKFWAALWASITPVFRNVAISSIMRDLLGVVI